MRFLPRFRDRRVSAARILRSANHGKVRVPTADSSDADGPSNHVPGPSGRAIGPSTILTGPAGPQWSLMYGCASQTSSDQSFANRAAQTQRYAVVQYSNVFRHARFIISMAEKSIPYATCTICAPSRSLEAGQRIRVRSACRQ